MIINFEKKNKLINIISNIFISSKKNKLDNLREKS